VGKRAAQTPVSRSTDELDRRLVQTLAAHQGPAGICPRVPRLAALLGVSESTLHRALRRVVDAGQVKRIPVHELPEDPEWQRRGHRISHKGRQTTNSYLLNPQLVVETDTPPGVTASEEPAGQTPVSPVFVTPLEERKVQAVGGYQGNTDKGEPIEFSIEPPETALLDHDPGVSEILATLTAAFGHVQVLEGPATYRTARGRTIDLATCSAEDLHQAIEQLRKRHTCDRTNGGPERCTPGHPCGRHTPRRKA
jgi:hypothetical protein